MPDPTIRNNLSPGRVQRVGLFGPFFKNTKELECRVMNTTRFTFPETVPLHESYGSVRVIGSRITLDFIVGCLEMGATAEDIHDDFPWLGLEQIKVIIAWYLNNQAEVDEYIREGEEQAEKLRHEIESRPESIAFKARLRSRIEQLTKN